MKKTYMARKPLKRPVAKRLKRAAPLSKSAIKKAYKAKWGTKTRLREADDLFSLEIRQRDGKCLFPGCKVTDLKKLQCSHYIGRGVSATRFDPDNCIALCWFHHFKDKQLGWEYQKQTYKEHGWDGRYTIFMQEWLGTERWNALLERSESSIHKTDAVYNYLSSHAMRANLEEAEQVP